MENLILILGLIFGSLIALSLLIIILSKSKREVEGAVKHGNTEAKIKIGPGAGDKNAENAEKADKKESFINQGYDLDKLTTHRFFTSVLCQYTADNCTFNLYNETLRLGIIKDDEEIASFKKLLASKYLHQCLFKVLGEHVRQWINDIVNEVKTKNNADKAPGTFFAISQYITQYKSEGYKEGKQAEFKYNGKSFYGIPAKFMTRFNNWSDSNMNRVYNMISDVLYSTQNNWFAKTIELLDLFEVIFMMLHDQMDATLIILNGEIAAFLKKLKERPPDELPEDE
jgi:hypothetical protein